MTENLMHGIKENQPHVHLVLQLEDARIGDQNRLESIKKILNTGQELSDVDKRYLEEQGVQLQKTIDHQTMADWAIDFVQKLKETKKGFTVDEIIESLEKEKNTYKIDKKFLKHQAAQLKQAIEEKKESKWMLGIISQLRETKIGDADKINYISWQLKYGKNIEDADKQYLKEKARYLSQVTDCKTKVILTQVTSKKLQENEQKHSKKLEEIKKSAENGILASEREQRYLNLRYEKLHSALDQQNKIEWTIQIIKKLEEYRVDNYKKLDEIKQSLEDEMPVPENDIKYLKEEYKLLQQMLKRKKQIDWTLSMINELLKMEIGNPERLAAIKKSLEEGKEIPENEITYLEQKCELLMIAKQSEKDHNANNHESQEEKYYHNSILTELNTATKELEKFQTKFQVA